LRKNVGDNILAILVKRNLVGDPVKSIFNKQTLPADLQAANMPALARGISVILNAFAAANFIKEFSIDEEDVADIPFAQKSFDDVSCC
jgi:hypothetical protein